MKKKWKSLTPPLPKFEKIRGGLARGGVYKYLSLVLYYKINFALIILQNFFFVVVKFLEILLNTPKEKEK